MVRGIIGYVRRYLDCSPEAEIFLHGVEAIEFLPPHGSDDGDQDKSNGATSVVEEAELTSKTCLHYAAGEKYPRILELLLQRGASPNAIDLDGRYPLAEAALWGPLENIKLLFLYGAGKYIECLCSGKRLRLLILLDYWWSTSRATETSLSSVHRKEIREGQGSQGYKSAVYQMRRNRANRGTA
jgi:ankyrin repeat protein